MARYRSILRAAAALVLFLVAAWGADAQDILVIDRDGARWKSGNSEEPSVTVTSSGIINALPPTSRPELEPGTPELAAVPPFTAGRPSDPQLVKAALAKPSRRIQYAGSICPCDRPAATPACQRDGCVAAAAGIPGACQEYRPVSVGCAFICGAADTAAAPDANCRTRFAR